MLDVVTHDNPESFSLASGRRVDAQMARAVPHYGELLDAVVELGSQTHQDGASVYDVGCGTGTAIEALARRLAQTGRAGRFVGVDVSEAMIARAEHKLRPYLGEHEISLRLVDASEIDFHDASLVLVNYSLTHLPETARGATLARIFVGLRPGGLLILSDRLAPVTPVLYERFRAERGEGPLTAAAPAMSWGLLAGMLAEAGFQNVEPILARHGYTTVVATKGG